MVERAPRRARSEDDAHHRATGRIRASQLDPLLDMTRERGVTQRFEAPSVWPPRAAFPSLPKEEAPPRSRRALVIGVAVALGGIAAADQPRWLGIPAISRESPAPRGAQAGPREWTA